MSFSRLWLTYNVYDTSRHLILKSNHRPVGSSQLNPEGRWRMDGGKGKRKQARQSGGSEAGKEGGSEAEMNEEKKKRGKAKQSGGRKRGSALRTKLKSKGCNSNDLKTILY